jgi:hypothetical protein
MMLRQEFPVQMTKTFNMILSKILLKGFQYFLISSAEEVLPANKNSRNQAERFPPGFPECIHGVEFLPVDYCDNSPI